MGRVGQKHIPDTITFSSGFRQFHVFFSYQSQVLKCLTDFYVFIHSIYLIDAKF